jgi:type II secretory pathway component GspD/PulD (secretin)
MTKKGLFLSLLLSVVLLCSASAEQRIEKIDFNDAAVLDVVRILARQADLDLVISGDSALAQNRRTSLRLRNVTAEEAIDHVLLTNGISYEKKGEVILISLSSPAQNDTSYQKEIRTIFLKYLSADTASTLLNKVMPPLKTSCGSSQNHIILQGKRSLLDKAEGLIHSIDNPVPQVLIESKVLEVSESDSMRLGVVYGDGSGSFRLVTSKTTKKTRPAEDLIETLYGLINDGKAKLVATPKIATLDNREAVINIGSRIPYAVPVSNGSAATQWTVDYIDAGVKLKITPRIGKEGDITTSIQPEVSSIAQWKTTAAGDFPVISTRNARATLRVKDGETIVVGGLLSESDRENISRLPIIGYIPLVGILFSNKTAEKVKTEIIFLITPHII